MEDKQKSGKKKKGDREGVIAKGKGKDTVQNTAGVSKGGICSRSKVVVCSEVVRKKYVYTASLKRKGLLHKIGPLDFCGTAFCLRRNGPKKKPKFV